MGSGASRDYDETSAGVTKSSGLESSDQENSDSTVKPQPSLESTPPCIPRNDSRTQEVLKGKKTNQKKIVSESDENKHSLNGSGRKIHNEPDVKKAGNVKPKERLEDRRISEERNKNEIETLGDNVKENQQKSDSTQQESNRNISLRHPTDSNLKERLDALSKSSFGMDTEDELESEVKALIDEQREEEIEEKSTLKSFPPPVKKPLLGPLNPIGRNAGKPDQPFTSLAHESNTPLKLFPKETSSTVYSQNQTRRYKHSASWDTFNPPEVQKERRKEDWDIQTEISGFDVNKFKSANSGYKVQPYQGGGTSYGTSGVSNYHNGKREGYDSLEQRMMNDIEKEFR